MGPELLDPTGAYFVVSTNALASSGVFIIGQIIPKAPASRDFIIIPGSFQGTLTIGVFPDPEIT